jgi:hypothetical protein
MSTTNRPQDVQRHLERTVNQGSAPSDQQLVFDPTTGELVVQSKGEAKPSPDAFVADQITEDGFFYNREGC